MNVHDRAKVNRESSPPDPKHPNRFEDLLQDCIQELMRIESNLRIKGDVWRAEKVKVFRIEYFGVTKEELVNEYRRPIC